MQARIQNTASQLTTERSALEIIRQRQEDLKQQIDAFNAERTQLSKRWIGIASSLT